MRRLPRVRAHCAHSSAGSLRNAVARIGPQRQKRTCVLTHVCSVKARRACGSIPLRRIVPVEYPRVPSSKPLVVAVDSRWCADRIDRSGTDLYDVFVDVAAESITVRTPCACGGVCCTVHAACNVLHGTATLTCVILPHWPVACCSLVRSP